MKKLLILLLLAPALTGQAQNQEYDSVIDYIIANSAQLRSERSAGEAAAMARSAANTPEGPELSFDHLWPSGSDEDSRWGVEVSQSFDWPGAYRARRQAARAENNAQTAAERAAERGLERQAASLLLRMAHCRQKVGLYSMITANLDSLQTLVAQGYESGQVTALDFRKVALERVGITESLEETMLELDGVKAELNGLARGAAARAEVTQFPKVTLMPIDYYRELMDSSPEAVALAARASAGEAGARAAGHDRAPGFSVGYLHEFEDGTHFNGLSVGITLPSYGAGRKARAAKLEAESVTALTEARLQERRAQLEGDYAKAERLERITRQMSELTDSNDYLSMLQKLLQGRAISMIDYFNEVNYFISARINCLSRQLEYQELMLQLNLPL